MGDRLEGRCPLGLNPDRHPLAGATNTNEAALIRRFMGESMAPGRILPAANVVFRAMSRYSGRMMLFRNALPADADRCFAIETSAYEGDEAATLEKIAQRIATYPDGFLVVEHGDALAGFINSGCAHQVEMADEAFKELIGHDPDAPNVVILSVAVDPSRQGQGIARALMAEFVARMRARGKSAIYLMCREYHIPMYEKFGFGYLNPSASDHGGLAWHEMSMTL